ncbi:MAG: prepilin-type N-terminal cleavage/methylation domain-containing protein [Deltaproteobacteria bacterium]|nr:prepilin-type N-terminal cleavage/methylation domain-containing protein [Deltaproteobacteria bacterium]
MFKRISSKTDKPRNEGFTLVELLIVVAIIAILAAIAIPQFSLYRQRAFRASMVSDAKNTSSMLEFYFITNQTYVSPITSVGPGPATAYLDGAASTFPFSASTGNTVSIVAAASTYTITVSNSNAGAGKSTLTWTSAGACTWVDGAAC